MPAIIFSLGFIATSYFILFADSKDYYFALFGVWLTFNIACLFLCYHLYNKSIGPLGISYHLVLLFVILLPACYQLSVGRFFWQSIAKDYNLATGAMVILLLSTLFFEIAYLIASIGRYHGSHTPKDSEIRHAGRVALALSLIALIYSLYSLYIYGPIALFAPRIVAAEYLYEQLRLSAPEVALVLQVSSGLSIGVLAISLTLRYFFQVRNVYTRLAVYVAVISNLVANFPVSSSRYMMAALVLTIVLACFSKYFIKRASYFIVVLPLLMYITFPILGAIRYSYSIRDRDVYTQNILDYLVHGDFDGFQSVMNVVYLVEEQGFALGSRITSAVLFFIPRAIWSGKAQPTGRDAAEVAGYSYKNISMPLPGEIYADAGLMAVCIVMIFIGFVLGKIDRWYLFAISYSYEYVKVSYIVVIASFLPIIFRGSLLGVIQACAGGIFVITIFYVLISILNSGISRGRKYQHISGD